MTTDRPDTITGAQAIIDQLRAENRCLAEAFLAQTTGDQTARHWNGYGQCDTVTSTQILVMKAAAALIVLATLILVAAAVVAREPAVLAGLSFVAVGLLALGGAVSNMHRPGERC